MVLNYHADTAHNRNGILDIHFSEDLVPGERIDDDIYDDKMI